jgi:cytochrome c biogenesis protein CcdA
MGLTDAISQALSAGNVAALPLALAGGVVAGMNPCCLALYPAVIGACCGVRGETIKRPLGNAVAFVLGIAAAVAALGVVAADIGRITAMATPVRYAIASLPILMGVWRLGWIQLPLTTPKALRPGIWGAFGTGLLLSLIIGPCGTPMLASVLSFAAYKRSLVYGGLLLFLYGVGNGLPLLMVGTAAGGVLKRVESSRFGAWMDPIVGGLLIVFGLYLLWRV